MKPFKKQLIALLLSVLQLSFAMDPLVDYISKNKGIDESALAMCWIMNGEISEVEAGNPVKGHLCSMEMPIWTADKKHAEEYCYSRFSFPIVAFDSGETGGEPFTKCTFRINLFCDNGWTQIHNRCYRVPSTRYTFSEAQTVCKKFVRDPDNKLKPGVALYYSDHLGVAFADLEIADAWITVPDIKERFENGEGEAAVFVQDSAFKYDTKPGTLILPEGDEKHQALCEYTPMMTKAEMYYIADIYKEIYPIHVTSHGASITSSSYVTVTPVKGSKDTFNADEIKSTCSAIGKILNVNSFPLVSILDEWKDAKAGLDKHRFYLTAAHKNEGCSRKTYMDWDSDGVVVSVYEKGKYNDQGYCNAHSFVFSQFTDSSKEGRYPTPAAFRAPVICSLHSYGFEYADCETGWFPFVRAHGAKFCHFIENKEILGPVEARKACHDKGAVLGGFDSDEEFAFVRNILKTTHKPPSSRESVAATHFRIGASYPCKVNCFDPKTKKNYAVGWEEDVSRDTDFLHRRGGFGYKEDIRKYYPDEHISFRDDMNSFHDHPFNKYWFPLQHYICGKWAPMKAKKNVDWTLRNS